MNNNPDGNDDGWLRAYHEASAQDQRRPDPSVGDAVRAHARMLAKGQAAQVPDTARPVRLEGEASNAGRWKLSMLGSLAVVGLVGLLVLQFDQGSTPQEKDSVQEPVMAPPAVADKPARSKRDNAATATVPNAETRKAAEVDAAPADPVGIGRSRAAAERESSGAIDVQSDMHRLAAEGRWSTFAQRLEQGVPIDIRDARGQTPLMLAAAAGQRQMVQHLLEAGADPSLMDHAGKTARQLASDAGRADVLRFLPSDTHAGQIGR